MVNTKTIRVPHLGGIEAAYQMPREYNPAKPTVVMINAFTMSSELYRDQFDNTELADQMNLIAIELLGHGQTRTAREQWTYWDTAEMNLQVLDALKIDRTFVLGTSQGGWVTVQMALLRPEKILGIIPMGTSMDSESERTRQLDCWNGPAIVSSFVKQWAASEASSTFEPDDVYCDAVIEIGLNQVTPEVRDFWRKTIKSNYQGEEGRRRIRMAAINLAERGGLHLRLCDIQCPVLWLHGTKDAVYTIANAKEEIQLFTRSPSATLVPVDGGAHFLNASHPEEVNVALLGFVNQYR